MQFRILFLLVITLILAACGGSSATPEATPTATTSAAGPTQFQIVVVADDFAVGTPRIPIVIYDGPNIATNIADVEIAAFDLSGETPRAVWSAPASEFADFEVPYWVINPEIGFAGVWGMGAVITTDGGERVEAEFAVQVEADTRYPDVGDTALPTISRTAAETDDLALITSDWEPDARLYELTVADALESGLPTIVSFSTPAFCQTAVCGPVIQTMKQIRTDYADEINVIHIEIYKEFQELVVADEVVEWGLASEPWTYVIDANGVITARFGGPVSELEISRALEDVTS